MLTFMARPQRLRVSLSTSRPYNARSMKTYPQALLTSLVFLLCTSASAQTGTLVVCLNKTTQKITVKGSCSSGESVVSGKNLGSTVSTTAKPTATPAPGASGSVNYAACYSTSAKKAASTFDGRVAVGVLCTKTTDILINDQFSTSDNTTAKPVVERKDLVLKGKTPNGVSYGFLATGGANKIYEVQVTALCCPTSGTTSSATK